jgi:Polysulphide reductase, NrfD
VTPGEGEKAVVPRAEPRSYYGQPVVKEPVWTWEIPLYFFTGGMAGASAGLAFLSQLRGNDVLARRAWGVALAGVGVSPVLLISDLGRPSRFFNMLRLFKVTSPMSVGSWLLAGANTATSLAAADALLPPQLRRRLPLAAVAPLARPAAAALGLPLSTYTAVLIANTSVPVWHEARRTLPFVFAGGAAASAGAAATLVCPPEHAGPARRMAVIGAVLQLTAARTMEEGLGELARPYREGVSGRLARGAQVLTAVGGMALAGLARRSRPAAIAGAGALAAGALLERCAVYLAGSVSARDPAATVGPQRERIARGETRGAERLATR